MQKNRLQELTHKLNVPLPIYQTVNEGFQHAPKFRSTVLVDGVKITSEKTFWTRKAAEKDVAELALKHISQKKKDEEFPQGFLQDFSLIQEVCVFVDDVAFLLFYLVLVFWVLKYICNCNVCKCLSSSLG